MRVLLTACVLCASCVDHADAGAPCSSGTAFVGGPLALRPRGSVRARTLAACGVRRQPCAAQLAPQGRVAPALRAAGLDGGDESGATAAVAAGAEGLSRKERRRLNRKSRNNGRNRLGGEAGSIRRKDALSQHFLVDESIIMSLVDRVEDTSPGGKCVVELGPGLGAITTPLIKRFPQMTAVELDGLAVRELSEALPSLDVREMSLLDFDFAAHAAQRGGRLTVIANVPFGITSQTLYTLLDNSEHIARAVLVLQQEVINRVLADQTQRKYSSLSIEHMLRCLNIEEICKVPAIAFSPPPRRTNTAALVIDYAPEAPMESDEAKILRAALVVAFGEGNKPKPLGQTLTRSSALRRAVPDLLELCQTADINWLRKKPTELAPGKWLHIARSLTSYSLAEPAAAVDGEEEAEWEAEEVS